MLRSHFGTDVTGLSTGLPKISTLSFRYTAEAQDWTSRKLLMSVARDARVLIIKLADRLHNMRTLEHLPEDRQRRIALETREIYAPLAHRFGMAAITPPPENCPFKLPQNKSHCEIDRNGKT